MSVIHCLVVVNCIWLQKSVPAFRLLVAHVYCTFLVGWSTGCNTCLFGKFFRQLGAYYLGGISAGILYLGAVTFTFALTVAVLRLGLVHRILAHNSGGGRGHGSSSHHHIGGSGADGGNGHASCVFIVIAVIELILQG